MKQNDKFTIALPKGRILDYVLPILSKIGIEPEETFFDNKDRKLRFNTNISYIDIIRVRSFDVVTFLAYGAAQMAFVGSDVLTEFNHTEVYSPFDLNIGQCRMVVAAQKETVENDDDEDLNSCFDPSALLAVAEKWTLLTGGVCLDPASATIL